MMTMNTNKTKVLVVEDNPLNMELVFEILTAEDFTVHKAVDGEEAIKLAGNNSYDLVLMDIELPGMSGIEVTKIIKNKNNNLPVIALTSYAMTGDREKFLATVLRNIFQNLFMCPTLLS